MNLSLAGGMEEADRDEPLRMEGLLVASPPGRVRIVLEPYCLEFAAADVRAIDPRPAPPGLDGAQSHAVLLELAPQARLLRIASAETLVAQLWRRGETFASASRVKQDFPLSDGFREREREFYRNVGL